MVVLFIAKNADYFIKDKEFVNTLKATYGWADSDEGPFSFVGYLRFILQEDTWINELFIYILSIMWQAKITIVHAHNMDESKVNTKWS